MREHWSFPAPGTSYARRVGISADVLPALPGERNFVAYSWWSRQPGREALRLIELAEAFAVPYVVRWQFGIAGDQEAIRRAGSGGWFRGFDVRGDDLTPETVETFRRMGNVAHLTIQIEKNPLDLLHELPTLRSITLEFGERTPLDLTFLDRLPALEAIHLVLYFGKLADVCWPRSLEKFRSLKFSNVEAQDSDYSFLDRIPKLHTFDTFDSGVTNEVVARLVGKELRRLRLAQSQISDEALVRVAGFRRLRELGLTRCGEFSETALVALAGLTRLRDFDAGGAKLGGALRVLAAMPDLRFVNLVSAGVHDADLIHLAGADKLTGLELMHNTLFTGSGLALLGRKPSLRGLECGVSDAFGEEGMAALPNFPNLEHLTLSHSGVTNDGFRHLESLRRLRFVSLSNTQVRGPGLRHLADKTKLRNLHADGPHLPTLLQAAIDHDLAGIAYRPIFSRPRVKGRPSNADVRTIRLASENLTPELFRQLGRLLNLAALSVELYQLSPASAIALAESGYAGRVEEMTRETIDLTPSSIDGPGVLALAPFMANVRVLRLPGTTVSEADAATIAAQMPTCEVVRTSPRRCGDEGSLASE